MADARPIVSRRTRCGARSGPLSDKRRKGPPIRVGPRHDGRTVRSPAGFRAIPRRAGERALLKGRFTIDRRCAGLCGGAGAGRQTALTRRRRVGRGLAGGELQVRSGPYAVVDLGVPLHRFKELGDSGRDADRAAQLRKYRPWHAGFPGVPPDFPGKRILSVRGGRVLL